MARVFSAVAEITMTCMATSPAYPIRLRAPTQAYEGLPHHSCYSFWQRHNQYFQGQDFRVWFPFLNCAAKALWASAHLTDKLAVQNALFPEGILYRTDIRFFEPPDNELQALVFSMLLSSVGEEEGEEIKSGRGARI